MSGRTLWMTGVAAEIHRVALGHVAGDWAIELPFVYSGFARVAGAGCREPGDVEAGAWAAGRCSTDGADAD